jgi:hypothetical protein
MPHHAHAPVAGSAAGLCPGRVPPFFALDALRPILKLRRAQRLAHRHLHRVELVVAGHLLDDAAAIVLEHDEVAQQVEQAPRRAQALDHHLQLGHMRTSQRVARDGAPGLEPLAPGAERAHARLDAVGNREQRIRREQHRHLGLVGLELLEGTPDRGVLGRGVLEFQHRQRQSID